MPHGVSRLCNSPSSHAAPYCSQSLILKSLQILIHHLAPETQATAIAVMARLNALFPPFAIPPSTDGLDLTPYSPGLRESIRFSIYEHLMGDENDASPKRQSLQTRLFSRCNLPGYLQAWQAFTRYAEEFKKMEIMCFEVLNEVGSRRRRSLSVSSPIESTFLTSSSASHNSGVLTPVTRQRDTLDETPPLHSPSPSSVKSNFSVTPSICTRPLPSPLLKGMPGREISGAKTDGAAFAGDTDAPPILTYPDDFSTFEFEEHPLAKHLDLSLREKAQLALVLPKHLASRDF